jgi:hypothetical protein
VAGERFDEPTHWLDEPPQDPPPERESGGSGGASGGQGVYFPTRPIGYDRAAVDAYVEQAERRIADLEATQTPEAAIRRALEQVGEETSGILRHAQATADDITARSRAAADDRLETARRDAEELKARGEYRVRRLDADADAIWRERTRLLDDVKRLAEELLSAADRADMRFPPEESPANTPLAPDPGGDGDGESGAGEPAAEDGAAGGEPDERPGAGEPDPAAPGSFGADAGRTANEPDHDRLRWPRS